MFCWISSGTLAVFIPIIFVVGSIFVVITALVVRGRAREIESKERLIAMEKGIALPEPETPVKKPVYSGRRAAALVILGTGLGLTIALWVEEGADGGVWGLIPLFIGVGLLIAAFLDKKEYETSDETRGPLS